MGIMFDNSTRLTREKLSICLLEIRLDITHSIYMYVAKTIEKSLFSTIYRASFTDRDYLNKRRGGM